MALSRRKLIKVGTLGGASLAGNSTFFFPKPANAYSVSYKLSRDGRSDAVFRTFLEANIARGTSQNLPPSTDPAIAKVVQSVQNEFTQRSYNDGQTPFSRRLGNPNNPLWGRQRNELLGPNPGFGTVQVVSNTVSPIAFTGSTTVAIDSSIKVLGSDEHLDAVELDAALMPTRNRFEDWGTWDGDVDPRTGEVVSTKSITTYETRYGSVTRIYKIQEPGPGGFADITFIIDGGKRVQNRVKVRLKFE